jgi:hypothetical protein
MVPQFASTLFNNLSTFETTLTSTHNSSANLLALGHEICASGLETEIGVGLLHKHFPIRHNELVFRIVSGNMSFTYVTKSLPEQSKPCIWAYDNIRGPRPT